MLCAVIFAETLAIRFPVEIHRHISNGIEDIDKKRRIDHIRPIHLDSKTGIKNIHIVLDVSKKRL